MLPLGRAMPAKEFIKEAMEPLSFWEPMLVGAKEPD
jgi:hypothetical protein